jgi:hypothetical protein
MENRPLDDFCDFCFAKIANHGMIARPLNGSGQDERRKKVGRDFFAPGGRRNLLKRLKTAKEIQEHPSLFL